MLAKWVRSRSWIPDVQVQIQIQDQVRAELPAITIRSEPSQRYIHTAAHTCELSLPAFPLPLPQHMPHSPTKAPSLSNIPCSIERAHNHAHSVSTCAFWPPSGNWQYQYPIPNNRYQNQMQLQINAPCGGGFFPKKVCAQRSCQKWVCNWNSLLAKQHTRTCGDQV